MSAQIPQLARARVSDRAGDPNVETRLYGFRRGLEIGREGMHHACPSCKSQRKPQSPFLHQEHDLLRRFPVVNDDRQAPGGGNGQLGAKCLALHFTRRKRPVEIQSDLTHGDHTLRAHQICERRFGRGLPG